MQDYFFGKTIEVPDPNPELKGTPWSYVTYHEENIFLSTEYGGNARINYSQIPQVIALLQGAKSKRDKVLREKISQYEDILKGGNYGQ